MLKSDDSAVMEEEYTLQRSFYLPWEVRGSAAAEKAELFKEVLRRKAGAKFFGPNSFVSPQAHVYTNYLELGENSWVAGGAILRGAVIIGRDCSVNPYAHIAGHVRIGNSVRIAGLASIYAFNHGHLRLDIPIFQQPNTSKGVIIGDDVWVGANVLITDGVIIGGHSIVAGGSVVTKSFPSYSIIAGNPAKVLRSRRETDILPKNAL